MNYYHRTYVFSLQGCSRCDSSLDQCHNAAAYQVLDKALYCEQLHGSQEEQTVLIISLMFTIIHLSFISILILYSILAIWVTWFSLIEKVHPVHRRKKNALNTYTVRNNSTIKAYLLMHAINVLNVTLPSKCWALARGGFMLPWSRKFFGFIPCSALIKWLFP